MTRSFFELEAAYTLKCMYISAAIELSFRRTVGNYNCLTEFDPCLYLAACVFLLTAWSEHDDSTSVYMVQLGCEMRGRRTQSLISLLSAAGRRPWLLVLVRCRIQSPVASFSSMHVSDNNQRYAMAEGGGCLQDTIATQIPRHHSKLKIKIDQQY